MAQKADKLLTDKFAFIMKNAFIIQNSHQSRHGNHVMIMSDYLYLHTRFVTGNAKRYQPGTSLSLFVGGWSCYSTIIQYLGLLYI